MAEKRRREIRGRIELSGYVEARQLAAELGVDVSTIRRDLDVLSRAGVVQRTHGGALPMAGAEALDVPYEAKKLDRLAEKRAIARHAATLVGDGESLVLDSGSTTYALAEELRSRRDLTIVTNDLRIAHFIAASGGVRLLVTGGQLIDSVFTLVGPQALGSLTALHVDWAFLAADAVDSATGVMNVNTVEVEIKQAMLATARRAALLADSSKFDRRAVATVVGIDRFDAIVTDAGLPARERKAFGDRLVCVPVAGRRATSSASSES
ncbi:MAG TPA: DeoR/GlpR family DNA-binding transcription regulator [Acidimicrobiales bacterium]|nr:DeoR/GlpR family DNA-binding transcription regulator [Acidimicrobiales bacterium]